MIAMRGTEFNSYHCVLRDIESGGALRIRRRCRVTRLLWNASERRVHAVEYHDEAGVTHTIETRSVVLAAGAIESAKILLNSTSDTFPEGLGNEHDVLGRYLHDHPRQWWPMRIEPKVPAPHHPMYLTRASPESSLPLMATSATIGLRSPIDRLRTFVRGSTSMLGVQIFGTMVPSPEHGIRPNSDDPLHGPVDIAITYDEQARHNIDAARERVTEVFAAAGADVEPVAPFHELHPGSSIHFGGTVRMHDDPHYGMSDGTARLHAVRNVAVCDLSAFTTGPEKNPTLTSMAIAARAADHLAADLRDGTI
jgi:choline dehydrogenase-like flavoprotein